MSAPLRHTNSSHSVAEPAPLSAAAWHATIAGLCGSFVAIGLARFAYTPLIPPLISAHWFSAGDAVTLGAANFAGYLAGALLGRPLAAGLGNRQALRLLMVAATAAFFACAFPVSVTWFFVWRFLSGLAGGAIMVLVATSILPHIPVARRGFVSGMIFLGLGLGIAASGTLVPALLRLGLRETWIGLGALSLVLAAVSWSGWPATNPPQPATHAATHQHPAAKSEWSLRILYGQYAANALGLVPAMVLLVDYVARGLGRGADVGAAFWVVYGVAAITGPVLTGYAADRIGFASAYRGTLLVQAVADAILAASGNPWLIGLATVLLGISTPGIVPLALGRIQEILPHSHIDQRAAWSRATSAFALFQALGGYGYSYLFIQTGENYSIIFLCGAVALLLASLGDVLNNVKRGRKHRAQ
ncbi:YbfB/YjiJ family MFS transporter [Rhizobium calliandrae]|uniref:YbfB/YjiJ family MFS transporter n=1 Tax=Rhizobium calliandrae TaxID=1312182 RepID=A0ABT7KLP4_9HYPH|nr:YbfB/YjiJ family MFS transporter [Rhizobium calliandrae]MDL2409540.1 YbfB/YjiJ family MFS transporter [Rhizobium calliandrae]